MPTWTLLLKAKFILMIFSFPEALALTRSNFVASCAQVLKMR